MSRILDRSFFGVGVYGRLGAGVLAVLFIICSKTAAFSQTSDTNYSVSLTHVLGRIEEVFSVGITAKPALVQDHILSYGEWRIDPSNLEISLTQVLAPFDLTFHQIGEKEYEVRKYEYARNSVYFGSNQLKWLTASYGDMSGWEERKASLKACFLETLDFPNIMENPILTIHKSNFRKYRGYTVENISIEIFPGVFSTGSIYRPTKSKKKNHPVILSPNGHFANGRYGKDQQIRNAKLASMGAVVVSYDLFAWGESLLQYQPEDHRTRIAAKMQLIQGIKWLDYLLSLPDADKEKVAVTGGSGGGSQTLMLTAIDNRIKVSAPVVMVSSHFSGGCPCESGLPFHLCGLRTNNAEIAAMAAPKPQLIVSDGKDWTSSVPALELPFILRTYGFYQADSLLTNAHFAEEGHDYGYSKRVVVYDFMAKYLDLDLGLKGQGDGSYDESFITPEDEDMLKVFGKDGEKLPKHAVMDLEELSRILNDD
ncbi:acetylxylan esterase [Algoriphagus sp. NG3]|uniref:alpha/beta hydrolase family protein n=1 Tax=Algoriphagus sp. NG3 TaxID=3097546 RepID=UPI002A803ED4|nr:acetylxylan esterase [Algoriphagus sp. NG3]WPR77451.1 acetylxylan esterase [Algoriphagus sp. NG3]